MRKKALFSLVGALIAAIALVSASGAATAKAQKVARIDVSTRAAVIHYLHSIHVRAEGAVVQRGLRNYAGAKCPGSGWTCATTKHTVVQITKAGGTNRFLCKRAKCAVVQISGVSHGVYFAGQSAATGLLPNPQVATCIKTTGVTQSCSITQTSSTKNNQAVVYENLPKSSGLTQSASATASITQQAAGGANGNEACVTQNIAIDGSTTAAKGKPVTVTLDAHQSVTIKQDVRGSGANLASEAATSGGGCTSQGPSPATTAGIAQIQVLTSSANGAAAITQNEDTTNTSIPCGSTTNTSNLCLDIEQNQATGSTATGPNTATFDQENQLVALGNTAAGGSIAQTQGNSDPNVGGLLGTVNQNSNGGLSSFTATQNETQCEDAFKNRSPALPSPTNTALCDTQHQDPPSGVTVTQQQYGPEGMGHPTKQSGPIHYQHVSKNPGDSSQSGNPDDTFTITQKSTQNNDTNSVQNNHIIGGLTSSGNGTVTQNAIIQNQNKEDVQAGTGTVSGFITCTGSTRALCTKSLSAPKIETKPSNPTAFGADDASFTFSNADPTVHFVCKLDDAASYTLCTGDGSGSFSSPNLPSGSHTLSVKTEDPDNNTISANDAHYTWVITPPDPTITSTPPVNPDFSGNSYTFTFTDADPTVHFQCQIDSEPVTSCNNGTSPTYSDLDADSHTFSVTAYDQSDTYPSNDPATSTWTILPLEVSALGTDGSSAGWACEPGGPIGLTLGTDSPNTFGAIVLTDVGGTAIDGLSEPTFTSDNYAAGSPRYNLDLNNGDSLIGYPGISGLNGTDMAWAINNGNTYTTWSAVRSAESGTTVVDAYVVADGDQAPHETDRISDLTFDGTDFNSGTCPSP